MALGKAVSVGAAAAIAAPFLARNDYGRTGDLLRAGALHVELGGLIFYWSWPIFCAVTLAAFLLLRAAER